MQWLRAMDNSLNRLNAVINWESFHPLLIRRFDCLTDQQLRPRRLLAQPVKLVDDSPVKVPRQRNTREENAVIKGSGTPAEWAAPPAKQRQKDVDARWSLLPLRAV